MDFIIREVDADQAKAMIDAGDTVFLDVRDRDTYEAGHIPGAISVGDDEIQRFFEDFPKAHKIVCYCWAGNFSRGAVNALMMRRFTQVWTLWGGMEHWKETFPDAIETGPTPPVPYPDPASPS